MSSCPKCGKEVLDSDRFCLNCGQSLDRPTVFATPNPLNQGTPRRPESTQLDPKSPWTAAILNFFLPGLGYVYVGMGRDSKTTIFGIMLFVSLALAFYTGVIGAALAPPPATSTPPSSLAYISLLTLLFPFAAAYDGFHRAKAL